MAKEHEIKFRADIAEIHRWRREMEVEGMTNLSAWVRKKLNSEDLATPTLLALANIHAELRELNKNLERWVHGDM